MSPGGAGGNVVTLYKSGQGINLSNADARLLFNDISRVTINATETIINNTGGNFDFRVEGDTDTHALFVDASTDNVGIGATTPTEKLEVSGSIKMVDGNEADGYVMTSDINGVGSWQVVGSATNFANTDLTFSGARSHDTNGNSLELTSDGALYGESHLYMDSTKAEIGFGGNSYFRGDTNGSTIFSSIDKLTLQNGLIKSDIDFSSATANRTYTLPDATGTVALVNSTIFAATISQTNNGAPTLVTQGLNTLGGTIVWSRTGTGTYKGTLAGAFSGTTTCFLQGGGITASSVTPGVFQIYKVSSDVIEIVQYAVDAAPPTRRDGFLNASIKIEVY